MVYLRKILIFLFPFLFLSTVTAQDVTLTASVDKNPVGVNEQFTYEVQVSGASQNLPDVDLPDLENFAILGGPNVSSSFQIVNFKMSASKTYSVVLMPRKVGTFVIAPATAKYKGKTISSNSIRLQVVQQSGAGRQPPVTKRGTQPKSQPAGDLSDLVFLKVIPSKRTVYVNEEVTLRYKIYFRTNINDNQIEKLPEAVGCWVEEYPVPQRPRVYSELLNGVRYNVAEIKKVAIFPSKAGKITISPLVLNVDLVVQRRRSRRSRSLFDDFFDNPFGQVVKRRVSSGKVVITSLPLPETGKPQNFSGLVGDFRVHSSVDKKSVKTNEAISYKIKLSGSGLLKFLNELPIEFSPDFEVYEPKVNQSLNKTGAHITSNKEFEYVLIPRAPGDQRLKSFQIPFFNPKDRKYHTLTVPEYVVHVTRGKEVALGVGSGTLLSKEEVKLLGKDIRFIKETVTGFTPVGYFPYQSWWFYFALIFPLFILGIAWNYRNHLEKMSTNVQYARSRKANKQARARLKLARSLMNEGKGAEFYGEISRALMGYVADKTNHSAAGLVRGDIQKILNEHQVNQELQTAYQKCLDEADFRRFAPGVGNPDRMADFYKEAEKILVQLEKYF